MDFIELTGIAIGLAMDAFSVSIAAGLFIYQPYSRYYFRLAFHFGFFQFIMPIIGYLAGSCIEPCIRSIDHWIALLLLSYIGGKMIYESFQDDKNFDRDPSRGLTLVVLSIATSIDALAVGLSLGVLNKPIIYPSIVIGLICAAFSVGGIAIGRWAGSMLGNRVERLGGIILIMIGTKIVIEHLG